MNKKTLNIIFVVIISLLIFLFFVFPYIWMILMSFKNRVDILSIQPKFLFTPTLQNYIELFQRGDFLLMLRNSFLVVLLTLAVSFAFGLPAAYGFARYKFKRREDNAFWILTLRMAPPMAVVIPYFVIGSTLRALDTIPYLSLVYLTFNIPFVIWMMRSFFEDIPIEIEESAKIDGLSDFQIFLRIDLPLVTHGMAATAILCTIFTWNEFAFAMFLTSQNAKPVSTMVTLFQTFQGVMWGQMAAAAFISTIPMVIFAIIARRWLVRGLTFGAIK